MSKFYAVVLVVCTQISFSCFAQPSFGLSNQEIVRATLWHQGIEKASNGESKSELGVGALELNYPEELLVALDKMETQISGQ